jgi:hypothetical protein
MCYSSDAGSADAVRWRELQEARKRIQRELAQIAKRNPCPACEGQGWGCSACEQEGVAFEVCADSTGE